MMTPVCRTNDQWTVKFRLASDPTKYASQPYEIFVQREDCGRNAFTFVASLTIRARSILVVFGKGHGDHQARHALEGLIE